MAKAKLPEVIQQRVDELRELARLREDVAQAEKHRDHYAERSDRLRAENAGLRIGLKEELDEIIVAQARIADLRAFVGLVLEYCEKETPYWYGEDLKTRARKLLKETE